MAATAASLQVLVGADITGPLRAFAASVDPSPLQSTYAALAAWAAEQEAQRKALAVFLAPPVFPTWAELHGYDADDTQDTATPNSHQEPHHDD